MSYENEEDYEIEENEFLPEKDAYERVGRGRSDDIIIIGNRSLADATKLLGRMVKNEDEKIDILINAYFNKFKDELLLDTEHLEKILEIAHNLPNLHFKNPIGIIFGYAVIKNAKIDKDKFNKIASIENSELNPEDILRYARLFINIM